MQVRHQRKSVDVSKRDCPKLPCFWLFSDKGSFTPGVGYTSYHSKERWCCGTRRMHGCPTMGVCLEPECRRAVMPSLKKPEKCERCGSTNLELRKDPQP